MRDDSDGGVFEPAAGAAGDPGQCEMQGAKYEMNDRLQAPLSYAGAAMRSPRARSDKAGRGTLAGLGMASRAGISRRFRGGLG
jgi:hypothetical protein